MSTRYRLTSQSLLRLSSSKLTLAVSYIRGRHGMTVLANEPPIVHIRHRPTE